MKHNYLILEHHNPSAHWAVSRNEQCILLQVDDGMEQARIKLTPEEAMDIARALFVTKREFQASTKTV